MRQINPFSDERLDNIFSYCGDFSDTGDHVPSKILLEEPYPENLPKVPCCHKCNNGFSLDEEFFACALECIIHGTTDVDLLKRRKIKSALSRKESLRARIESSFITTNDEKWFRIDLPRFENVITKLAKGHLRFENSEPQFDDPTSIVFKSVYTMDENEENAFFTMVPLDKAHEVGSRGLHNLLIGRDGDVISQWTLVQEGAYEYMVITTLTSEIVRMLIWEYLAVEVIWRSE